MLSDLSGGLKLLCLCFLAINPGLATNAEPAHDVATVEGTTSGIRSLVGNVLGRAGIWPRATTAVPGTCAGTQLVPYRQNGVSVWGMFNRFPLPLFRNDGGTRVNNGWPWGRINTVNTNPYTGGPYTAVVRSYNFELAECDFAPDGVTTTKVLCINGQFPGPLIEANYGDNISVTLTNSLKDQGTSMHWHGFLQTNANAQDGVPGVTQCPIIPGGNLTYNFRAELYGTSWYAVGATGPMVIYGPSQVGYDIDLGPVILNEWYRQNFAYYVQRYMNPLSKGGPALPLASSNLINGKMRFPCSKAKTPCTAADYAKFNFTSGRTHRLRLVNTGAGAIQKFSIDNHVMTVIANDFMPIQPYDTSMIALGVGQRADVIVRATGKPTDVVWMRSNIVGCSLNDGSLTEALAIIYYEKSDHVSLPTAGPNQGPAASTSLTSCANDPLTKTVPAYPLAIDPTPELYTFNISLHSNGTNLLFYMNNATASYNYDVPALLAVIGNTNGLSWWPSTNSKVLNHTATSVRVVLYNYDDSAHPIHLHGHNAQILNVGVGQWDGSIVRPDNPQRRDVFIMPPGSDSTPSFLALQWPANNPGMWPLHCHFAWHSSMGLVANFFEMRDVIGQPSTHGHVPRAWINDIIIPSCDTWHVWSTAQGVIPTDIDSGVKARDLDGFYTDARYEEDGRVMARELFPGAGVPSHGNYTSRYERIMKEIKAQMAASEGAEPDAHPVVVRRAKKPEYNARGIEIWKGGV
ncbi:MAG: hypothetical protein Q9162_007571 [Coniocarpon cinnabarinum]